MKNMMLFLILAISFFARAEPAHTNLIEAIEVKGSTLCVKVNKGFKAQYLKSDFFVEYSKDIELNRLDYSLLSMPFLMNVISIVWISGKHYVVNEMDKELFYSLKRVKKVFKYLYPQTSWKGSLTPLKLVDHALQEYGSPYSPHKRTALLFSGGVDSFSSALHHRDKKILFITAWGHWDLPLDNKELWDTRRGKIESIVRSLGGELTLIRSNYTSFLNWEYLSSLTPEIKKWRLGAVEGLGWAGVTGPILITKGYSTLHIASSHTWLYPYPSAATPYIDNNIRWAGIRVIHDEFDKTRLQKIKGIAQECDKGGIHPPFLKICSWEKKRDKNCGTCRKCISTAVGFYACGSDPRLFGINLGPSTAVKRALELLKSPKQNYYTLLYFKEMQQRIQSDNLVPSQLKALFKPLLSIDLTTKIAWDVKDQKRLDWQAMKHFLPELIIPSLDVLKRGF